MSLTYTISLVLHIFGVIVAVGSATIVDYLHLIGLKKRNLEKSFVKIYPYITNMINFSLFLIYITGIILLTQKPSLLSSPLFLTKLGLVLIVTINGIYLQKVVSPNLDSCVIKGTKHCTKFVLNSSAISGSISIVTWYSIVILSLTKNLGYTTTQFLTTYVIILISAILISYIIETKARNWRE
jgi:hypothetical protein